MATTHGAGHTDAETETAYNNQVSVVSQAEAEAGTATTRRGWNAERVKQAILALAGGASLPVTDTTAVVKGSVDATKLVRIEADGIGAGTTRVLTMADEDIDLTPDTGSFASEAQGTTADAALPKAGGTMTGNIVMSSKQIRQAKGADVIAANALPVLSDGNYFDVTGATPITSIDTLGVGVIITLHFDAALTLTHDATDLILPGGANITTAAGDEATFVEYATGDWRCLVYTKADGTAVVGGGGGKLLQAVHTITTAYATGTTQTPLDDSIPTSIQGDEYITRAITPANSSNRLIIECTAVVSPDSSGTLTVALHQDSGDAIAAVSQTIIGGSLETIPIRWEMAAGTTSSTTFKIRIGKNATGTTRVNGITTRIMGGVMATTLSVYEIG